MITAWQTYDIDGDDESCTILVGTNDDEDRGYGGYEGGYASWTQEVKRISPDESALDRAKRITGRSRVGISGVQVTVRVNGEMYE